MASPEDNRKYWDEVYDWQHEGQEWSRGWGSTAALWSASLQPRVARFLPASTVLEIAPGYGRFTPYLAAQAERYLGVDISAGCVAACQERFPDHQFFCNDGETLPMIQSASVDFIFSFFSLIHAEKETLLSYLKEFARVLKPSGGGFVHHSNLAEHARYFARLQRLPGWLQSALHHGALVDLPQWRAPSVCAQVFAECAERAGLALLCQETVNFGSRRTIDAFSSFVRADGPWRAHAQRWNNPGFMAEAMRVRRRGEANGPVLLSPERYGALQAANTSAPQV